MKTSSCLLSCLAFALCVTGCSREREISGQIFIVTQGGASVKMGLVGVHALSEQELETVATKMFKPQSGAFSRSLADRLFANLPPPAVKTDADGQFTIRAKGKVWILARAERKVGNNDETYLWAIATEGQQAKVLLSNDNFLAGTADLRFFLETIPSVTAALAKEDQAAAEMVAIEAEERAVAKAAAEAKAAEKRLAWTGAAMCRAGFKEDQMRRTLTQGGTVVAWGDNDHGESTAPADLSGVVAIAAAGQGTIALKENGTVVAWGRNDYGEGTVPAGLSGVVAIAAGSSYTVALKQDGTVVAWGYVESTVPAGLSGVVAIAAGMYHTVALKEDGTVVAWGSNIYSQNKGQSTVPADLSGVVAIAAGTYHTVALKQDGTVVAWGNNDDGESTVPAGLSGVVAITAGDDRTVALKQDGTVVAWGDNYLGRSTVPAGLSGVVAIAAYSNHTVALKQDGTVVAWGDNDDGEGTVPAGLSGVVAIAAGWHHTVALKLD